MSPETDQQPPEPPEEQLLCTSCAAPNRPSAHFCIKCGAPLSSYAMIAPFERLFAEGFIYRRATEHPRNLITVSGIWFIFGMMALGGLIIAIFSITSDAGPGTAIGLMLGSALMIGSLVIIVKTTRNYLINNRTKNSGSSGALKGD